MTEHNQFTNDLHESMLRRMFIPSGNLLIPSFPLKILAQRLLMVSMVQMG